MDKRETGYSSKSAAIRGMWRYYNQHLAHLGRPLVGEAGTVLQWCDNGKTRSMAVSNYNGTYTLIKSWKE